MCTSNNCEKCVINRDEYLTDIVQETGFDVSAQRHPLTYASYVDQREGEFKLMTLRAEGQFNTVVYEDEDLYRGNTHRNVVMLSASDAKKLGVREGDRMVVESEAGSMMVAASLIDIRPGNLAMYYPEANALVPQKLDQRSRTPAFKSIDVRLRPMSPSRRG